jgi:hypothetical protein
MQVNPQQNWANFLTKSLILDIFISTDVDISFFFDNLIHQYGGKSRNIQDLISNGSYLTICGL